MLELYLWNTLNFSGGETCTFGGGGNPGLQYIVTLTDYFSKWAEASPLPNKTADGVARFIHSVSQ